MVVDRNMPVEYQLWGEAQRIIHMFNAYMVPFMRLFVIKVDHGLSPFLGGFILRMSSGKTWRTSYEKRKRHRINVTLFVSVISKIEEIVELILIVMLIMMMMKPNMVMVFIVKVMPKVKYLLIVFNRWCDT